jgi:hypothetical protein
MADIVAFGQPSKGKKPMIPTHKKGSCAIEPGLLPGFPRKRGRPAE